MSILIALPADEKTRHRFQSICSDAVFIDREHPDLKELARAEAVLGNLSPDFLCNMPALKWVQLDSAGADSYLSLPEDIILTNASGAYGTAIGEYMLACTLAGIKRLYEYNDLQKEREWINLGSVKTIADLHVLCLGMGNIGTAYASRMKALGASIDGVRRTLKEKPACFDHQYTMDDLDSIISGYDVVAMSLPGTDATIHIMNHDRLARMRQGSILINVGRGSAIDEDALYMLAGKKHFAHVFLDVTSHEPLPKNNPLWHCPSVTITPHISGKFNARVTYDQVVDIMCTNLTHYLNGEPLEHVVNRHIGY
jgi:phosphoglycerate dehydrogenase-like enzyme